MYNRRSLFIRRLLLKLLHPLTQWIGKLHLPYTKKLITGKDFQEIEKILVPGMVFLTQTRGEISNLVNPGFWKHGAIYAGNNLVVEALGDGVQTTNIYDFIFKKDFIAVMKPLFATEEEMQEAAWRALQIVGCPYDFNFELKDKAFYCFEVVYRSYKDALWLKQKEMPFRIKTIKMGVPTIIGEDFYNAHEKWKCVWQNKDRC